MALCNTCGTEHDRHCPCYAGTMPVGGKPIPPAKAKFAHCCRRCGNDEWHIIRRGYRCAKCGLQVLPNNWSLQIMPGDGSCRDEQIKRLWREAQAKQAKEHDHCQKCGKRIIEYDPVPELCSACQKEIDAKCARINDTIKSVMPRDFQPPAHEIDQTSRRCRKCGLMELTIKKAIEEKFGVCGSIFGHSETPPTDAATRQRAKDELVYSEDGQLAVFCGTTGDKEHIKERAGDKLGFLPANANVRCRTCSRLMHAHVLDLDKAEYVCPACRQITSSDAPLQTWLPIEDDIIRKRFADAQDAMLRPNSSRS